MEWNAFRVSLLTLALIPLTLVVYQKVRAADEKPPAVPLTTTERLALASLNERGRILQQDSQAFVAEVCGVRGWKVEECSIDPTGLTVAHVIRPTPPPAPPK